MMRRPHPGASRMQTFGSLGSPRRGGALARSIRRVLG